MKSFEDIFFVYNRDVTKTARHYLNGLLQAGNRKNMEHMSEVVPDSNHQSLHHFISNSNWDYQEVINRVGKNVGKLLNKENTNTCLIIDETTFTKKGKFSAGVARQYLGSVGKIDNGQVGVFSSLCNGDKVSIVGAKLYLPKEWTNDKERCAKAKVPDDIGFKTKDTLAYELILEARELGIPFKYSALDAGYGKGLGLMNQLDSVNEKFIIDIHKNQQFYIEDPQPFLPKATGRGPKPKIYKSTKKLKVVEELVKSFSKNKWEKVILRKSKDLGEIKYDIISLPIWTFDKKTGEKKNWNLVCRRNSITKDDYKYSLCNEPLTTPKIKLAQMQGQRYWVERSFQDAKSACGMADYQIRSWVGWHKHMALVMMTMNFMLSEKLLHKETIPLLSSKDIEIILANLLPAKNKTIDAVLKQMTSRHKQRHRSLESKIKYASG